MLCRFQLSGRILLPLADAVLELCLGNQHSHKFLAYTNISYLHPHNNLIHYQDCFVHYSPQHPHLDPYIGYSDYCNCDEDHEDIH